MERGGCERERYSSKHYGGEEEWGLILCDARMQIMRAGHTIDGVTVATPELARSSSNQSHGGSAASTAKQCNRWGEHQSRRHHPVATENLGRRALHQTHEWAPRARPARHRRLAQPRMRRFSARACFASPTISLELIEAVCNTGQVAFESLASHRCVVMCMSGWAQTPGLASSHLRTF